MDQYWYLNSQGNGQQYNNQISLYSQSEITTSEVMNDLKIPENWSYRVYPVSWDSSANMGFNPAPLFSWATNYGGIMPQGHPANWTPLPSHAGFNFQKPPFPGQPFNHTGMFAQGHLALLSPPAKPFHFNTNNSGVLETLQDGVVRGPNGMGK